MGLGFNLGLGRSRKRGDRCVVLRGVEIRVALGLGRS